MSIVREVEKNLDGAIWHMQLAFDCQPSNIAIQEELKRLFDLRDGKHPDKIRLTRGALVRMYARGELFQQAIEEIKSALSEEPKRIDLQVFLAKMFFLSGETDEALGLCERLIVDLPYCYEINQILVSILKANGNSQKADQFANRLIELNPYQAYVNDIYSSVDQVPDEKVVIDKLENIPAASLETEWFSSIKEDWQQPIEGKSVSSPIESIPPSEPEAMVFSNPPAETNPFQENEIPQQEYLS
jgi:tetratricopeptide (TPR) repeat protein